MAVYLRAISLGSAVPRLNYEVAVHSVFRSALNLQLAGEGMLLTLLLPGEFDLPQGIRLDAPQWFTFAGLPAGTRGFCRDHILGLGSSLIVDLQKGRHWECDLSALDGNMTKPALAEAWRHAWRALSERGAGSGTTILAGAVCEQGRGRQSVMVYQMSQAVRSLLRATRQHDMAGMEKLGTLVGLGSGLTPGGDDLLTGYLAGLWCTTRGMSERRRFVSTVGELVVRYSTRTNDISRTYLYHAACGQVSSRLADLATSICEGADRRRVLAGAEAAMQIGHTSGMEAVNGLLLGLAAWDGPRLLAWGATSRH